MSLDSVRLASPMVQSVATDGLGSVTAGSSLNHSHSTLHSIFEKFAAPSAPLVNVPVEPMDFAASCGRERQIVGRR